MGYLKIRNLKTGKVYDSRGRGPHGEPDGRMDSFDRFVPDGNFSPRQGPWDTQIDEDKFLDVFFDDLPPDEKAAAIAKSKEKL